MPDPLTSLALVMALAAGLVAAILVAQHLQSGQTAFFRHYLSHLLFFNLLILSGLVYRHLHAVSPLPPAAVPLALVTMAALKLAWLFAFGQSAASLLGRAPSDGQLRLVRRAGLGLFVAYTGLTICAWLLNWPMVLNGAVLGLEVGVIGGALWLSAWVLKRSRPLPRGERRRALLSFGVFHFLLLLAMLAVLGLGWLRSAASPGWVNGLLLLAFNLFPPLWIRRYRGAPPTDVNARYDAYGITAREREVVVLIRAGRTNQEIADELFLSLATIKDYNNRLYRKCGVRNRVELANLCTETPRLTVGKLSARC